MDVALVLLTAALVVTTAVYAYFTKRMAVEMGKTRAQTLHPRFGLHVLVPGVVAAVEKAGTHEAVMVGDTPWDVEAARKAGIDTICLITGGWSKHELLDAGAAAVYESIEELRRNLDDTPLFKPSGAYD